jgi:hypothetical protein
MGLGVLEYSKLPHVPGTVILDDGVLPAVLEATGGLKHAKGKKGGHIVLNPQPSEDPNDPLVSRTNLQHAHQIDIEFRRTGHSGSGTVSF